MKKVRVGVVEDELIIAENLLSALEQIGYETVGPAISFSEGIELLKDKPDIFLLDIQLSGYKTGIDFAKHLNENNPMPFIYLTSHSDKSTVDEAKKTSPHAYLVKPFTKEELYTAIEIAIANYSRLAQNKALSHTISNEYLVKDAIFVKDKGSFKKVYFEEVLYLKNDHVYIELVCKDCQHLVRSNLNEYLERFPSNFVKIHRSYAININYLEEINPSSVIVNGQELPVAKSHREELLQKVKLG